MPGDFLLLFMDESSSFGFKVLIAFILISSLAIIFKLGLRRVKFTKNDLNAAGLNRQRSRMWRANRKKKKMRKRYKWRY